MISIEPQHGVTVLTFSSPILSIEVLDELSSKLGLLVAKDEPDPPKEE